MSTVTGLRGGIPDTGWMERLKFQYHVVGKPERGTKQSQPLSHPSSPNCCWPTDTKEVFAVRFTHLCEKHSAQRTSFRIRGETSSESHCGLFRMIVERQSPASWANLTRYVSFGAVSIFSMEKKGRRGCMAHYEPRKGLSGSQPGRKPSL